MVILHNKKFPLIRVNLQVTRKCNLNCLHCYAFCGAREDSSLESELSMMEINNLIQKFIDLKVQQLTISGGEPLLRKDILDILKISMQGNFSVLLATNGTLITRDFAISLKKIGIEYVSVGLDGDKSSTHDWLRDAPGSFDLAIKGIKNLLHAGIKRVRVVSCAHKRNYTEIPSLIKKLDNWGVAEHWTVIFLPVGKGKHIKEIEMNLNEINYLKKKIGAIKNNLQSISVYFDSCSFPLQKPCSAGVEWCCITPQGYVVPCTFLSAPENIAKLNAPNIRNTDFESIWDNYELFKRLRNFENYINDDCARCNLLTSCGGGCRAYAFTNTGNSLSQDPRCIITGYTSKEESL